MKEAGAERVGRKHRSEASHGLLRWNQLSLDQCSVCVVDGSGQIVRELKVSSDPYALVGFFTAAEVSVTRVGLEAGPLSQWLHDGLIKAGLPAILIETRHLKAALSAMRVRTDRNDARGIAQLICMGWFRPVHAKTLQAQEVRTLLTARKQSQRKLLDVEGSLRGILRGFGLKIGMVGKNAFTARIRELVHDQPTLEHVVEPMLRVREALRIEFATLHRELLHLVRADETCRRLMTVPGVGPIVAITSTSAVDDPTRFAKYKTLGPHFGLTPKKYHSGEVDRIGRFSKVGDRMIRTALFEAATVLLTRTTSFSALNAWALRVASRQGLKKARLALACKLAVVLHLTARRSAGAQRPGPLLCEEPARGAAQRRPDTRSRRGDEGSGEAARAPVGTRCVDHVDHAC